jgi:hypothetical protein
LPSRLEHSIDVVEDHLWSRGMPAYSAQLIFIGAISLISFFFIAAAKSS